MALFRGVADDMPRNTGLRENMAFGSKAYEEDVYGERNSRVLNDKKRNNRFQCMMAMESNGMLS
jgi:hypothetical protein